MAKDAKKGDKKAAKGKDAKGKGKDAKADKKKDAKADKPAKAAKADAPAAATPAPAGGGDAALVFERYDTGKKGYLDRAEFERAVSELRASPGGPGSSPRVGPWASSAPGSSLFPYTASASVGSGIYGGASRLGGPLLGGGLSGPFGGLSGLPTGGAGGSDPSAVALAQAYQTRLAALSSVAASLLGRRETLTHQLARVQSRQVEVAATRQAIENETLADTEAILHRLRSAEAGKMAALQADCDALVTDVSGIDAFYAALQRFQPKPPAPAAPAADGTVAAAPTAGSVYDPALALEFMRSYPELCAEADRLAAKPLKSELDVSADDLPRETATRLDTVSRFEALVELVAGKDRVILQLLKDREAKEDAATGAAASAARASDEADRLRVELAASQEAAAAARAEARALASRVEELTAAVRRAGSGRLGEDGAPAPLAGGLVPTELEHWIRLTERLTTELHDTTERFERLQAMTGVSVDPLAPRAAHGGAPAVLAASPARKPAARQSAAAAVTSAPSASRSGAAGAPLPTPSPAVPASIASYAAASLGHTKDVLTAPLSSAGGHSSSSNNGSVPASAAASRRASEAAAPVAVAAVE